MELPARKNKILNAVVKQYIAAGEPVGSKALLELLDFPVSSATVRNEMAALSEMGYLVQPHTSAGRIPTQLGYRHYLDHSIEPAQIDPRERRAIDDAISLCADDPEHILSKGAEILSQLTGYAALSTTPPSDETTIERIKIVQVSKHTSMMVMITSKGMVKNRLFRCDHNLNEDVLNDPELSKALVNGELYTKEMAEENDHILFYVPKKVGSIRHDIYLKLLYVPSQSPDKPNAMRLEAGEQLEEGKEYPYITFSVDIGDDGSITYNDPLLIEQEIVDDKETITKTPSSMGPSRIYFSDEGIEAVRNTFMTIFEKAGIKEEMSNKKH